MAVDWRNIYKKYRGKWVALEEDEVTVVGVGSTAQAARAEAIKNGHEDPILSNVPKDQTEYAGSG